MGYNYVVSDESIWYKSTLGFIYDFPKNNSQSICYDSGNYFIAKIAKFNWSKLINGLGVWNLWDEN